jgi:hypothetical protein
MATMNGKERREAEKPRSQQQQSRPKPVHEVRLGRLKAAIWANETEQGVRHNVTVCRLYRDGDQWRTTESFGRDDLLLLGKVLDRAHSWILDQGRGEEVPF